MSIEKKDKDIFKITQIETIYTFEYEVDFKYKKSTASMCGVNFAFF